MKKGNERIFLKQNITTLGKDEEKYKGKHNDCLVGTTCGGILVHKSGKFVIASNRGHDSLAVFSVNQTTGELSEVGVFSTHGRTPRHFTWDNSGNYVIAACQDSDYLTVFEMKETGELVFTDEKVDVKSPNFIIFRK